MKRFSLLGTFFVLTLLLVSCATSRKAQRKTTLDRAGLDIANLGPRTVRLYITKHYLGDLKSGERRWFLELHPGVVTLTYRFLPDTTERSLSVRLRRGRVSTVFLKQPGVAPRKRPPALTVLKVKNPTATDMRVYLDGRLIGNVLARDSRKFRGIPVGTHRLVGKDFRGYLHHTATIGLKQGHTRVVSLRAVHGELQVDNLSGEPLRVFVGHKQLGLVANQTVGRFRRMRPGLYKFRAIGAKTRSLYQLKTVIRGGVVRRWSVRGVKSSVWIRNHGRETVTVTIDGQPQGDIAPHSQRLFTEIKMGHHRLVATGLRSGQKLARRIELNSAEVYVWTIRHLGIGIAIRNRTAELATIFRDGRRLFKLKPGAFHILGGMSGESYKFEARFEKSRVRLVKTFELTRSSHQLRWTLTLPKSRLRITNRTGRTVSLLVNGRRYGDVERGKSVWLELDVGRNRVVVLEESGVRYFKAFLVHPGKRYGWTVVEKLGGMRIKNGSGEAVTLFIDGQKVGGLAFGKSQIFGWPERGLRNLLAVGVNSGHRYSTQLWINPEKRVLWKIGPRFGHLKVVNRLLDPVVLRIAGRRIGVLGSGKSQLYKLRIGSHSLLARRRNKHDLQRSSVIIRPVKLSVWTLEEKSARLLVSNLTNEKLEVRFGGRLLGRIDAGSNMRYQNLKYQTLHLTAIGLKTNTRYEIKKTLKPRGLFRWEILPATGYLLLNNRIGEPLKVIVDQNRTRIYTVATGRQGKIPLSVGYHRLQIKGARSFRLLKLRYLIYEGHHNKLTLRAWSASLTVLNRMSSPVAVYLGKRLLGTIPAKQKKQFRALTPGKVLLFGRYGTAGRVHTRLNLKLGPNKWTIDSFAPSP